MPCLGLMIRPEMEFNRRPPGADSDAPGQPDLLAMLLAKRPRTQSTDLHPSVQALGKLIQGNKSIRMLTDLMLRESQSSSKNGINSPVVIRDTAHLLETIDEVISMAPSCSDVDERGGLIGCPLNGLFRQLMSTPSGWSFFDRSDVNEHLRAILNAWSRYLLLPDSTSVLSCEDGWCSPKQLATLAAEANSGPHPQTFQQIYSCPEPSNTATLGFTCWDNFFLREFQPGQRPLGRPVVEPNQRPQARLPYQSYQEQPINPRRGLFNPCESTPVRLVNNVAHADTFWLKHQPYSLVDMLDGHWSVNRFSQGTIYQAFLSAFMYHRWHAPVSGRVVSIHHIQGTYFSQLPRYAGLDPSVSSSSSSSSPFSPPSSPSRSPSMTPQSRSRSSSCSSFVLVNDSGEETRGLSESRCDSSSTLEGDSAPPNKSQPYLAAVATRLLILFAADSPEIGLVGFMAIGMAEVSSCEAVVREGQHVQAGEQIGMFHYGGSSCCLLLEPAAAKILSWQCDPAHDGDMTYRLNGVLAMVRG